MCVCLSVCVFFWPFEKINATGIVSVEPGKAREWIGQSTPNGVSPNEVSPNDVSPNEVSPNEVSPNQVRQMKLRQKFFLSKRK